MRPTRFLIRLAFSSRAVSCCSAAISATRAATAGSSAWVKLAMGCAPGGGGKAHSWRVLFSSVALSILAANME